MGLLAQKWRDREPRRCSQTALQSHLVWCEIVWHNSSSVSGHQFCRTGMPYITIPVQHSTFYNFNDHLDLWVIHFMPMISSSQMIIHKACKTLCPASQWMHHFCFSLQNSNPEKEDTCAGITYPGNRLEQVNSFVYLGSRVAAGRSVGQKITIRTVNPPSDHNIR